jgi:hypothetical protein
MKIQEIIERNKSLQSQARELNRRAGQEVFLVMTQSQWKQWLAERISGARNADEIPDLQKIRLPELDPEIVKLIHDENPDQIEILGQMRQVEYPGIGYTPRVEIYFKDVEAWEISTRLPIWCGIPDEGYKLPGGRQVEIRFKKEFYGFVSGENGKEVKDKILSKLNSAQFENWPAENRPEIHIPNPDEETDFIPGILTAEYGRCVVYDTPLMAYGIIVAHDYSSGLTFEACWFSSRDEAEQNRQNAIARLDKYRSNRRKEKALADIQLPDPSHEDAVIPEIAEIEGGFGIVVVNSYRSSYGNDSWFKIHWTQSREEAEKMREAAVAKLAEIKAEEIRKRQLVETKAEAEVAKAKACELYYHSESDRLEQGLKDRLYKIHFSYPPSELEGMKAWTAEARAVCAEVEASYEQIQRDRVEFEAEAKKIENVVPCFETAKKSIMLAKAAVEFVGYKRALSILNKELNAPYGRNSQQEAIRNSIPMLETTEVGNSFLNTSRARLVDELLVGAVTWLKLSQPKSEPIISGSVVAPTVDALEALRDRFNRK